MKDNIPCALIEDLLPSYLEGLTSDQAAREIEKHLAQCGGCASKCRRMKERLDGCAAENRRAAEKEINYLKKLKTRGRRKVVYGALFALFAVILAAFIKLFILGFPSAAYFLTYTNTDAAQLHFGGAFYDSGAVYQNYRLLKKEDGTTEVVLYACLPSFWNRNGAFNLSLDLSELGDCVHINGTTVKKDGTVISKLANDLYSAKNLYLGDMTADGKLAQLLGLHNTLGDFENELQTANPPFGWTLTFQKSVSNSAVFQEQAKKYSCVLMALIENLGEIRWDYTVELEDRAAKRSYAMTAEECSEYAGAPIKEFAKSAEKVEELLERLGLARP